MLTLSTSDLTHWIRQLDSVYMTAASGLDPGLRDPNPSSSAVLVEMNISVWGATKLDKRISEKVNADNAASTDAGKWSKNLMAGTQLLEEISNFAAGCRLWHNTKTLPWSDKGPRLLPTSLFLTYKEEVNQRREKFEAMVDQFLREYPNLVQTAFNYLGKSANADDYPDIETLRGKFGFRLVFTPLPDSGDFRLDVPAMALEEMRRDYDDAFNKRVASAMEEPWKKLHKVLTDISVKLTDVENSEVKKRYHDTLLSNAHDLIGMLQHLNVTNDPKLEQARQALAASIDGFDMDDIKDSAAVRADVKTNVDAILSQYEW